MLDIFGLGVALQFLLVLRAHQGLRRCTPAGFYLPSLVGVTLSLAVVISLLAVITAGWQMPPEVQGQGYYEYLFWCGGHSLQFAYTQLVMLAWLLLARHSGVALPGPGAWYAGLLMLGLLPVLSTPLIYLLYDRVSLEARSAFTRQMQFGGGLAVISVGLLVTWRLRGSTAWAPRLLWG
jgi:hypothetical protein